MEDRSYLSPIFGRLPDDLRDIVCNQVEDFLQQASFLRRADLYQAHLVHTRGIQLNTPEEIVQVKVVEPDEAVTDPAVVDELSFVQALTTKLPPVIEQDVAAAFDDEQACKPQAVQRWFEDRNQAISQACSRTRKKYASDATASISMRGNAVLRRVGPRAQEGVHDAASALAACLSPMSALETSMKLMSLMQSDDPRKPALKDSCASRAFSLVSKCPSVMLQSMLLRSVINTGAMQLTALDRTEIYTVIAQWLQDAAHLHNDTLVQLCLGALWRIPFTEVHIICFARHHIISGTDAADDMPIAANNPTILEFIKRLTEAERPVPVQQAARTLLDKWARVDRESDHVIISGGPDGQAAAAAVAAKKKGAKGAPLEPPRPQVFPKDRRMKAPNPIALHRDGRGSAELAKTNTSNISKAAAQRRVHASSGPLSVSDIKKRKEQQQLMQKLGKKQKSLPTAAASMPPLGPSAAASRSTPSAATLLTPAASGAPADDARRTSVFSTASAQPESAARGSVAATPLNRTTSFGAASSQSPMKGAAQHGSPLAKERQLLPEVSSPGGMPPISPGGAAEAGGAAEVEAVAGAEEPKRGLSSLLQITQHAAAQQVRQRRETLPVPWQIAEASLDEACKMMDAARRGVRFHPEVRAALEAAIAHGEAQSKVRWAPQNSGGVGAVDSAALEALEGSPGPWAPEAITDLSANRMNVCASWAADSTEKAAQREREFLATAAPGGDGPAEVADVDEVPDGSAAAAAAEAAPRVPFWLQPPSEEDWPTDTVAAAWRHFEGRTHMVGIAQAWRHGLRFILAEPGIPTTGLSTADLQAARTCDSSEPAEPDSFTPEPRQPPPAAAAVQPPLTASPGVHRSYPPAMGLASPQQETQPFQDYQPPPAAPPLQVHAQAAPHPQPGHGAAAAYGVMQPVQYDYGSGGGHHVAQVMQGGLQYVQQAAPGQYVAQVVFAQPGMQAGGGPPMYGGQYVQPPQQVMFPGQQYPGGQAPLYHYPHEGGPPYGSTEQPGRMY